MTKHLFAFLAAWLLCACPGGALPASAPAFDPHCALLATLPDGPVKHLESAREGAIRGPMLSPTIKAMDTTGVPRAVRDAFDLWMNDADGDRVYRAALQPTPGGTTRTWDMQRRDGSWTGLPDLKPWTQIQDPVPKLVRVGFNAFACGPLYDDMRVGRLNVRSGVFKTAFMPPSRSVTWGDSDPIPFPVQPLEVPGPKTIQGAGTLGRIDSFGCAGIGGLDSTAPSLAPEFHVCVTAGGHIMHSVGTAAPAGVTPSRWPASDVLATFSPWEDVEFAAGYIGGGRFVDCVANEGELELVVVHGDSDPIGGTHWKVYYTKRARSGAWLPWEDIFTTIAPGVSVQAQIDALSIAYCPLEPGVPLSGRDATLAISWLSTGKVMVLGRSEEPRAWAPGAALRRYSVTQEIPVLNTTKKPATLQISARPFPPG